MPRSAKIHVYYAFSPSLLPQLSHIKLMMNGTLFATVQPTPDGAGGSVGADGEAEFTIPPELLVHNNALTMQFIGHYVMVCEDPANTTLWAQGTPQNLSRHTGRSASAGGRSEAAAAAVSRSGGGAAAERSSCICSAPSLKAIQAAGIVTSYFGMVSEGRPVRFPVHIGEHPGGKRAS